MKKSPKKLVSWAALIGGAIFLIKKAKADAPAKAALAAAATTPINDSAATASGDYIQVGEYVNI